jgi:hypothetical protein
LYSVNKLVSSCLVTNMVAGAEGLGRMSRGGSAVMLIIASLSLLVTVAVLMVNSGGGAGILLVS